MKKSNFWYGLVSSTMGAGLIVLGFFWNTPVSSLMCGCGGALLGPGLVQLWKYRKWTPPEHADTYRERLEQEQIDLRDERKNMLRDRSGRYAYVFGLMLCAVSILTFHLLEALGIVEETAARLVVLYLAAYLIIQYIAGFTVYRWLAKKY